MNLLIKLSLLYCVIALHSCAYQTIGVRYEGRLVERYQIDRKTKERHGFYKLYHSNRKVALEHNYLQGKLDGVEKIYHENGALAGILPLKDGKYDGHFTYYYINGSIKQDGYYKEDKIKGDLSSYHRNGKLKEIVRMIDNEENGPFRTYSKNGVLIKQGNYRSNGEEALEHGLIYEYDPESMRLLSKKICKDGYCCSTWERDKGYLRPSTSLCDEIMTKN